MARKFRRLKKGNCILVLAAVLLLVTVFGGGLFANARETEAEREFVNIKVAPGDTLWGLVSEHYDFAGNIRAAIDDVERINDLPDSLIYVGQTLRIPVE